MSEPAWCHDVVIPALLRHARNTYGVAMRRALVEAGFEDVPRNGLYVIGGLVGGRPSNQIWRLDPPSATTPLAFVPVATLPVPLADAAVAVDHGIAYVAGGESPALSSAVFSVEVR